MLGKCWVALDLILKLSDKVTLTRVFTARKKIGRHRFFYKVSTIFIFYYNKNFHTILKTHY